MKRVIGPVVWVGLASGCAADATPQEVPDDTECAEIPAQTSGGTWGPAYAPPPPVFVDAGERVDLQNGPDLPDEPPAPLHWVYDDELQAYYRRPTAQEAMTNGYQQALLLALDPDMLDDLMMGLSTDVQIPLDIEGSWDGYAHFAFAPLLLEPQTANTQVPMARIKYVDGAAIREISEDEYHVYLSDGLDWGVIDDFVAGGIVSSSGAIELRGAGYDRLFRLHGPYNLPPSHPDCEIPSPLFFEDSAPQGIGIYVLETHFTDDPYFIGLGTGGGAPLRLDRVHPGLELAVDVDPIPVRSAQCLDGLDNDPDGFADDCDFNCVAHSDFGSSNFHALALEQTRNFGLFGDWAFCSENAANWESILMAAGMAAATTLNQLEPPSPYDTGIRPGPFRLAMAGCFAITEDLATAQACHFDAAQCGDVGPYPFAGVGSTYGDEAYPNADYVNRVWRAVDAERDALGPMAQPLTFAVAIAGYADTSVSDEAFEGFAYTVFDEPETARVGASVVAMPRLLDPDDEAAAQELFGFAIAHEIGHSLGLAHDDTDWDGARGFMHSNGGTAPILDWDADSLVPDPSGILTQGEVWRDQAGGKEWPRSPGFGYRGCTTSPDSCAGSLTCNPLLGETDYDGAGGSPAVTGTCL